MSITSLSMMKHADEFTSLSEFASYAGETVTVATHNGVEQTDEPIGSF